MALITVSGEPGCRADEVGRLLAQSLAWQLVSDTSLARLLEDEFGAIDRIPPRAYPWLVQSILARLMTQTGVVCTAAGAELMAPEQFPALLRVRMVAPESWRIGNLMLEHRATRPAARELLLQRERAGKHQRLRRFGRSNLRPEDFDATLNASAMDSAVAADVLQRTAELTGLTDEPALPSATEQQLQFRARLELAKHGISPPDRVELKRAAFVHPSEQVFANLLDFYRIAWEYEPRSFPIQWDEQGKVLEAFTPDFYLPEFDLYVELTTMKQAHVTRKNRKIKMLRALYPGVNIQIFYQKDFENLIFKYGLGSRHAPPAETLEPVR